MKRIMSTVILLETGATLTSEKYYGKRNSELETENIGDADRQVLDTAISDFETISLKGEAAMNFLRKIFSSKPMAALEDNDEAEEATGDGPARRKVKGVLILTRRPLGDQHRLMEQIIDLQRSQGHDIAWDLISRTAVTQGDFDDKAFLEATILKQFVKLGSDDIMGRTEVIPCQDSLGNSGVYCIIFSRRP
ncbi:hypothetical protein [Candidatus Methylomirabilis limnetica]|nr:hypothetical protein [Candidatus Methylomirabilis limnetica]